MLCLILAFGSSASAQSCAQSAAAGATPQSHISHFFSGDRPEWLRRGHPDDLIHGPAVGIRAVQPRHQLDGTVLHCFTLLVVGQQIEKLTAASLGCRFMSTHTKAPEDGSIPRHPTGVLTTARPAAALHAA